MSRPRAFDHDRARALHAQGWSYSRIADHLGVSANSIGRACDPERRERHDRQVKDWIEAHRKPCLGGCGQLVWTHVKGRSGYCPACIGEQRAADGVRGAELLCRKCGEWKSDNSFSKAKRATRRGRRPWCRACDTAARLANRAENIDRERKYDRERKRRKAAA